MVTFKVLQSNQRFMSSILRIDVAKQKKQFIDSSIGFYSSIPVLLICLNLFGALVSSAVRMSNKSYDFTTRMTAAMTLITMCQTFTIFLNIDLNMQKIAALYQTLQTVVDNEG